MKKPKLMVIGLDSVSLTLLDKFAKHRPNMRKLMKQGITGSAIPAFPLYTPTNWAVLSTGADSSTTGAEGWNNDASGKLLSTFDRRAITCDTIFDVAARDGLKTLAIMYPGAHPTKSARNMVLSPLDRGLVSNCVVPGKIHKIKWDGNGTFAFTLLKQPQNLSGAAIAKTVGATEDGASLSGPRRKAAVRDVKAVIFPKGKNRWALRLSNYPKRTAISLRHETWSAPIPLRVVAPGRTGRSVVRVMVFDSGKRLAVSEAYDIGLLGKPATLAKAVYKELGPPTEHTVFYKEMVRLFGEGKEDKVITRLTRKDLNSQADWIVRASGWVQAKNPYDIYYLHYHHPDSVLHTYLPAADGAPGWTAKQRRLAKEALAMSIEICDALVGKLVKLAGPKTTVLTVSDHGNATARYGCDVGARLVETGLTVLKKNGEDDPRRSLAWKSHEVWGIWIDVNARCGTKKHEDLQARVIDALLDWKTKDGERVAALALRKKDAHLLGYYGPRCGDVVFHFNSGFSWFGCPAGRTVGKVSTAANHGPQMPFTFSKNSDNMAFFILTGPGVKKGVRWDMKTMGPIYLKDMVPTVCHIAKLPTPQNVCGAVKREVL